MNWNRVNRFRRFMRISWLKTIFLNFSMLPFKYAVCLPIIVTRNTYFYSLSGRIELTEKAKFGMIRLGFLGEDVVVPKSVRTLLQIEGVLRLAGNIHFGNGLVVRIDPGAVLTIGNNVRIGNQVKIVCYENITINHDTRIAWESQVLDTTFHYMRNLADNSVTSLTKPIIIGAHNWIGNRSNIMKGAVLPDYTIVAAGSLCNKPYDFPQYSLVAGSPCKLIKTGIYRCLDKEEREIKAALKKGTAVL